MELTIIAEATLNERCKNLLNGGKWPKTLSQNNQTRTWAPDRCMLYPYQPNDVQRCLAERPLTFLGDSTARELFWAVSHKLDHAKSLDLHTSSGKHQNIELRSEQAEVRFIWDPFLNTSVAVDQQQAPVSPNIEHGPNVFVIGAGLWHLKHLGTSYERELLGPLRAYLDSHSGSQKAILLPISTAQSSRVTSSASQLVDLNNANGWNKMASEISSFNNSTMRFTTFQSYLDVVDGTAAAFRQDGIHISQSIIPIIADILLNSICNEGGHLRGSQPTTYCCDLNINFNTVQQVFLLSMLIFVFCNLVKHLKHRKHDRYPACGHDSSNSRHAYLEDSITGILIVLVYCFVADRTLAFEKASKLVDQTSFIIVSGLMLLLGLASLCPITPPSGTSKDKSILHFPHLQLLSRSQTEEWKGWMQVVILSYHYFGMSKVLWAYQLARVLVASYLFMTGYGHTMYFLRTGDFSFQRVATVIFRTNILSIMLAFVMGTHFDLYYFPMLSSLWFLIIYITMVPISKSAPTIHELNFRILLSSLAVKALASSTSMMESLLYMPANLGIGLIQIDGKEFMFRFRLDAYVVYVGMFAAVHFSIDSVIDDVSIVTASRTSVKLLRYFQRLAIPGSCCFIIGYAVFCASFDDKYAYNRWHPIISPFAVVAFVILRNSTETISHVYSRWFAWFGRCSLETFVLQYHIWLAADSRGLLRLSGVELPLSVVGTQTRIGMEVIQFMFLSALFLWASSTVSSALPVLTTRVLNKPEAHSLDFRSQADLTISASPYSGPKNLLMDVRMKAVGFALLLWILNLCWVYSN